MWRIVPHGSYAERGDASGIATDSIRGWAIRASKWKALDSALDLGVHSEVYGRDMSMSTAVLRGMRVAELARAVGVGPDTIRYYEKAGLLPPARRTASGYREYDDSAVDRLRFIQGSQRLGLKLADIRDLLAIRDTGECPCEPAEVLLVRRLDEVDAEIARLTALRTDMAAMLSALPGADCPPPSPGTWCENTRDDGEEVITMGAPTIRNGGCDDPTPCCPDGCDCGC